MSPTERPEDQELDYFARARALRLGRDAGAHDADFDPATALKHVMIDLKVQRKYGMNAAAYLFASIRRHMRITRGALLVPVASHWEPSASHGIDPTTLMRLRIPNEVTNQMMSAESTAGVDAEVKQKLKPYLSLADFRAGVRPVLIPVSYANRPLALIVVLESPLIQQDTAVLDLLTIALSDPAGAILHAGRTRSGGAVRLPVVFAREQAADMLGRLRRDIGDAAVVTMVLNMAPVIDSLCTDYPDGSEKRIEREILEMLARVVGHYMSVFAVGGHSTWFIGRLPNHSDDELIMRLLIRTVMLMFSVRPTVEIPFQRVDLDTFARELQSPDER